MLSYQVIVDTAGVSATTHSTSSKVFDASEDEQETSNKKIAAEEKDNPRRLIVNFMGQHQVLTSKALSIS